MGKACWKGEKCPYRHIRIASGKQLYLILLTQTTYQRVNVKELYLLLYQVAVNAPNKTYTFVV